MKYPGFLAFGRHKGHGAGYEQGLKSGLGFARPGIATP